MTMGEHRVTSDPNDWPFEIRAGDRLSIRRRGVITEHLVAELTPDGALTLVPWPDDPGSYTVQIDTPDENPPLPS